MAKLLHIVTTVCISAGNYHRVGDIRYHVLEPTDRNPKPPAPYVDQRDKLFGKWQEVQRVKLEIDDPEIDHKQLTKLRVKELKAQRKEAEGEFYATTKRIDDEIASLLALESK